MTYFAQIVENIVVNVIVITQEFLDANTDIYTGTWVETFIDDPNKTYAGIGYTYDPITNDFIAPQPEPEPVE